MFSIQFRTTAQPVGFAMPTCGHAAVEAWQDKCVLRPAADLRPTVIVIDRERVLGTATTHVPGTTAWSPPSC